ncbi:type 1 glutamine amidotransferase-like domain-containing protein [Rahnella sp. SAP-1]|uniref:Type 1 glutamine amidotransferase-like domain-containing protein n=1 Tax=Rouxiella aceris TaxID=2703884 RepID=A0A848MMC6_9GAMM|nr:peptidase E [Rouxiella aceris]NMP28875.1 type 1 glutamine amidotransferase-like domain-containing protein [Rouxiella aceris]
MEASTESVVAIQANIVAIGGETEADRQTLTAIDRYILSLSASDAPKILFLPTANGDSPERMQQFTHKFRSAGYQVDSLAFFHPPYSTAKQCEALISQANIIFVAGGNTRAMLAVWREFSVDKLLKTALRHGTVLCGVSAGAICWFDLGHSDSDGGFSLIPGLGLLTGVMCPHFGSEPGREASFTALLAEQNIFPAYAAEDGVALHFREGKLHNVVRTEAAQEGKTLISLSASHRPTAE